MSASFTLSGAASSGISLGRNRRGGAVRAMARAVAPTRRNASLYAVLNVTETATAGEIKTAYRALAKRLHPDVAGAESDFTEINRAYATLSDPAERARYDSEMRRVGNGFGVGLGFGFQSAERGKYWGRRWETDQCW